MAQQERDAGDAERNQQAVTAQETSFDGALAVNTRDLRHAGIHEAVT